MLAAAVSLRPIELEALRTGTPRLYFGRSAGGLLAVAINWPGFGWIDLLTGYADDGSSTEDVDTAAAAAYTWSKGNNRGTVTSIIVDRHRAATSIEGIAPGVVRAESLGGYVDVIGALRYFTISPAATRYVGDVLCGCYSHPPLTAAELATEVETHQGRHPETKRWADTYAVISCKAGA
jgi:hypothetical protein